MPIYEYQALTPGGACKKCRNGFEIFQQIHEMPLTACLHCGHRVKKIISWCRSAVMETSEEHISVSNKITEYEKSGMWSHAAELADKHSENINDKSLKTRALENYKKAGYRIMIRARNAGHGDARSNDPDSSFWTLLGKMKPSASMGFRCRVSGFRLILVFYYSSYETAF
jgi:putative FmdB family regulatory protein